MLNGPPLDVDNSIVQMLSSFMPRFNREIAEGKVAEVTITLLRLRGVFLRGFFQPLIAVIPRFATVAIQANSAKRCQDYQGR